MYNADQCSKKFIEGLHYFLMWLRQTSGMVSYAAQASIARTRRITPLQGPFTAIFLLMVSCPITFFGPVMDKKRL
jgi:hypothetical protein